MWLSSRNVPAGKPESAPAAISEIEIREMIWSLGRQASTLGRDAAEVCAAITDADKVVGEQASRLQVLAQQLAGIADAQAAIAEQTKGARQSANRAGEVGGIQFHGGGETRRRRRTNFWRRCRCSEGIGRQR